MAGETLWTSEGCAARRDDLAFLSPDGLRLIVLYPLPEGVSGSDWSRATVARTFLRGREERSYSGADWVSAAAISDMSHDYSWVRGVGAGGGAAPRHTAASDGVELDLVDGATVTVRFDGTVRVDRRTPPAAVSRPVEADVGEVPAARALAAREADETTVWRWADASGEVHFSVWGQIPAAQRPRAARVTASIGRVSVDRAAPGANLPRWDPPPGHWPRPDPPAGPRLNGLTDAERHQQELARLQIEKVKAMTDEELSRDRVRRERELGASSAEREARTIREARSLMRR